jgi:hypothetical protein
VEKRSQIEQRMPVLALLKGRWRGTYIEQDLQGRELDRYAFFHDISFPDEPGANYRQRTVYTWADGRTIDLVFDAALEDRNNRPVIAWDHPMMAGVLFEIDDRTLQLRFAYKDAEQTEVQEAMFLSADGQHRLRTWHWYRAGTPFKITVVQEARA